MGFLEPWRYLGYGYACNVVIVKTLVGSRAGIGLPGGRLVVKCSLAQPMRDERSETSETAWVQQAIGHVWVTFFQRY